jgi:hypothetical protein
MVKNRVVLMVCERFEKWPEAAGRQKGGGGGSISIISPIRVQTILVGEPRSGSM